MEDFNEELPLPPSDLVALVLAFALVIEIMLYLSVKNPLDALWTYHKDNQK